MKNKILGGIAVLAVATWNVNLGAKSSIVTVAVETFNCDGVQQGSYCDQSRVGTKRV